MKVQLNSKVSVSYVLTVDGKEMDRADASNPLEFIFGHGQLLPAFEAHVAGLDAGETFTFDLSPEEGYGVYNEQNKAELPMELFTIDGELQKDLLVVGRSIPMQTNTGQRMVGRVAEVKEHGVVMDFNHELAGKTLHFEGSVQHVAEATDEELAMLESHCCSCDSCCDSEHGGEHGCCDSEHGGEHGCCGC